METIFHGQQVNPNSCNSISVWNGIDSLFITIGVEKDVSKTQQMVHTKEL